MNLIDFHVTKIINEEYDFVYKLYGMTQEKLNEEIQEECNPNWRTYLLSYGCKQTFEYYDEGGKGITTEVLDLSNQKPYKVGDIGQH